jgi:hypothetical protein
VYEIVIRDPQIRPGKLDKEVSLKRSPEFPNRLCWETTAEYSESVQHCDSYTITGAATIGGGVAVTVGADAGVVFARAKTEMEVTYTAEFTTGGGWTGTKCETSSWRVESPVPGCYKVTYRVFQAQQPTWAEAHRETVLQVRFINDCEINGSFPVHRCLTVTRADLLGEQCPVDAPGAGWSGGPLEDCHCPPKGPTACIERPSMFAVGGSGWRVGLSVEQWAGGVGAGCDMAWVDHVLPDLDPVVVVEKMSE